MSDFRAYEFLRWNGVDYRVVPRRERAQFEARNYYLALEWLYGADRADRILADQDPEASADIARWNSLGAIRGGQAA